ncbi:MAG: VCBS repeat-containing protein [Spirochaetota bacterium]
MIKSFTYKSLAVLFLFLLQCKASNTADNAALLTRAFVYSATETKPQFSVKCQMTNSSGNAAENWVVSLKSSPSSSSISTSLNVRQNNKSRATGTPANSPASISFQDTDGSKDKISGYIQISKASSETDITGYNLYWGKSTTEPLKQIAKFQKTGGNYGYILQQTEIPDSATHLLAFSYNESGENPSPTSKKLLDINIIATSDSNGEYTLPVEIGGKTVFVVIQNGEEMGEISFDLSAITSADQMQEVQNDSSKLNLQVNSSIFSASVLEVGIVTPTTESTTGSVPKNKAGGLSLIQSSEGQYTGVTIGRASNESDLTHYVMYFGLTSGVKLGLLAALPKTGSDIAFTFPSNLSIPNETTAILLFTKNNFGEMTEGIALTIPTSSGSSSLTNSSTAPTISNAYNDGKLQSGFLVGTSTDSSGVEVSIDGGTYISASGTTSWKYQLPNGASQWNKGSKHTISVRNTSDTTSSSVTSISVIKGTNKDINGDGYPDLVIGEPEASGAAGKIHIYHTTSSGLSSSPVVITHASTSNYLGTKVATDDLNGDGYADVLASSHTSTTSGTLLFFYSTGTGGITATSSSGASHSITMGYQSSITTGDFNGDKYTDIAVGDQYDSTSQGKVFFYYSVSGNFSSYSNSGNANATIAGGSAGVDFGYTVVADDFNQDGYCDIAISEPDTSATIGIGGEVNIHAGTNSGINSSPALVYNPGYSAANSGKSLATGDVNLDGYPDLAIAEDSDGSTAVVQILHSSSSGITSSTPATSIAATITDTAPFVAIGDVNTDGYEDVVFGTHSDSSSNGIAKLYLSSSSGASTTSSFTMSGQSTEKLGISITIMDIDQNKEKDILVGAPGHSSDAGRVGYFTNTTGSQEINSNQYVASPSTSSAKFGSSMN